VNSFTLNKHAAHRLLKATLLAFSVLALSGSSLAANTLIQPVNMDIPVCAVCKHPAALLSRTQHLKPEVLKLALDAYVCARQKGLDKQQILTVIDYSLPSYMKRLWVIDLQQKKVLFYTLVAHGRGSGDVSPTVFSNRPQSLASSIGLFETANPYQGHFGLALRLKGLEKDFNDNALRRAIVIHSAWYVSEAFDEKYGRLGRSWGCPALNESVIKPVINTIKNGTLVFAYYPDPNWLKQSTYLHCKA